MTELLIRAILITKTKTRTKMIAIRLLKLKLELNNANKLKWTETCFSSHYSSFNLFQARLIERNFGQPQHLHNFVVKFRCCTTISPTEVKIPGFFHCASVYVIVYQMWWVFVYLKLRQCWKKRLANDNRLSETWC